MVNRIIKRDNLTEEAAKKRMAAQMSNAEYVSHANVIFSTQWEPDYTQSQVRMVWGLESWLNFLCPIPSIATYQFPCQFQLTFTWWVLPGLPHVFSPPQLFKKLWGEVKINVPWITQRGKSNTLVCPTSLSLIIHPLPILVSVGFGISLFSQYVLAIELER